MVLITTSFARFFPIPATIKLFSASWPRTFFLLSLGLSGLLWGGFSFHEKFSQFQKQKNHQLSFQQSLQLQKELTFKKTQQDILLNAFTVLPGFLKGEWSLEKRKEIEGFFSLLPRSQIQWGPLSNVGDFQSILLTLTWEGSDIWTFLQQIPPAPLLLKELSWQKDVGGHLKVEWIDSKTPHVPLEKTQPPQPLLNWNSFIPSKDSSTPQQAASIKGYIYINPDKWIIWRSDRENRPASGRTTFPEAIELPD